MVRILSLVILFIILTGGCRQPVENTYTDLRDGNKYNTSFFAGREWTIDNLKYIDHELFCHGAWIYPFEEYEYNKAISRNISSSCGALYDWNTAWEVCSGGWHLPSKEEWEELVSMVYDDDPEKRIDIRDLNIVFDGYARSFGKYCIYDGTTFWTSTRSEDSENESYVIVVQILSDASLSCRFEKQPAGNAFSVRMVK